MKYKIVVELRAIPDDDDEGSVVSTSSTGLLDWWAAHAIEVELLRRLYKPRTTQEV